MSVIFLTTKKRFRESGLTLVEAVFYVVFLVIVMGAIVQTLVAVSNIYRNIKLDRELESSGAIAMETMLREIRNAETVLTTESLFDADPGVITVSGFEEDTTPYKVAFDTASGVLRISKDGGTPLSLTTLPIYVSSLIFNHFINPNSEGVRIELEVSGTAGSVSKSKPFFGFAVLRGSY